MAPILIAALGGLISERAGVLNIALEGLMLTGAFAAALAAGLSGSLFAGFLAGVLGAMLLAGLFAAVSIRLQANIFISGLAINLLSTGLISLLSGRLFSTRGVIRFENFPQLVRLEWGDSASISLAVPLSLLILFVVRFFLYKSPTGLRIRAAGYNSEVLRSRGVSPQRVKSLAVLLSGAACGIAGALLALRLEAFVPGLTAGRGWIALVAVFLGRKKPLGVLLATACFALADAAAGSAQGLSWLPPEIMFAFPYLITFLALLSASAFSADKEV